MLTGGLGNGLSSLTLCCRLGSVLPVDLPAFSNKISTLHGMP